MRFLPRIATAACIAGLVAGMTAPAQAATTPRTAQPPATARRSAAAPAGSQALLAPLRQARALARSSGRPVTVAADTTQVSRTVARPDGKFVTTTSVLPVRVRQQGAWVAVSARLRRARAGYRPAATPSGLTLSAGGRAPLAVLTDSAGGRLSLTVPFRLPAPSVTGNTATYRSVLPGVDLVVTASDQGGLSEVLVIRNAAAAADPRLARLRLATSERGLRVATDPHGNLTATAPDGRIEFTGPGPRMWDSAAAAASGAASSVAGPGPAARVAVVGMRATPGGLQLTPDMRMLTSRATRWPVYIDPEINPASSGTGGYVETQEGCPTYANYNSPNVTTEGIGYQDYNTCAGLYRSFYQINTTNLNSSMVVSSATLLTTEVYGADETCSDSWPVTLAWTDGITSATDWQNQPKVISTIATESPKSAWCGNQDVNFDVTSVMQTTATHNYAQWTFGLSGDEARLGHSSCSPATEYNCGYMRFNDNPSVTTVFDIAPNVPANTSTTPASHSSGAAIGPGCGTGTIGWIGKTDLGAGNGSSVTLNTTLVSNVVGEKVRAQYTVWDNMAPNNPVGSNVVARPDSVFLTSGTTVDTPVGIALHDGHAYGWRVDAYDGILTSANAPDCHFDVDLTAPTEPTVPSSTFPESGTSTASPPVVGTKGSFTLASTDPVPAGCVATCLASGVAYYEYSFNSPLPTSGAARVAPGAPLPFTPTLWGTNILYAAAVDNAGNVSQTKQYDFYVAWNPAAKVTAGDVNGDGIPDLLATDTAGDLLLFPGGTDPAVTPVMTASTASASPDGHGWNTFQITHRGSMSQGGVDDLFVHKGTSLWIYGNNPSDPGQAPQFGDTTALTDVPKASCAATAGNPANCTGYDATDWSQVTQVLAPGDVYAGSTADEGLPDLLTVENDKLWLYEGEFGDSVVTPVQLGSSGWSGVTLIAPGMVNGTLTLWARNNNTGVIDSWPLTLDQNGVPELGTAAVGAPVTASSGTAVGGVALTAAAYPTVVSSGPLTGGTCGPADLTACPGVYAEDTTGNLWYYLGQSASGGTSPLSGSRILVGNVNSPAGSAPRIADGY